MHRSCVLGEKVLIGAGTEIAENSKITNTVIGRRVKIGIAESDYVSGEILLNHLISI